MKREAALYFYLFLQLLWLKASWSDCLSKCGNLDIPYPFGIDNPNCSLSAPFTVTCDNSSHPPKAFWRDFQVLEISLQGEMSIDGDVSYQCYNASGITDDFSWVWNVGEDGPFTFSATRNKFTAIGCDTLAYIDGSLVQPYTTETITYRSGCVSYCSDLKSLTNGSCLGIGCCQTSIPEGVKEISFSFDSSKNHSNVLDFNPCSYAFLADSTKYNFSLKDVVIRLPEEDIEEDVETLNKTIPVAINWGIVGNGTCKLGKASACLSNNSYCYNSSSGLGYLCNCSEGYQGNPYVHQGCKDINECNDQKKTGCDQLCINEEGSFSCSCRKGYSLHPDKKTCIPKQNKVLKVILGIGLGFLFLLIVITWSYWARRKRRLMKLREKFFQQNGGLLLQEKTSSRQKHVEAFKIFTANELKKATDNYHESRIVGEGGYGTVYKGFLPDQTTIAIKKSKIVDATQIEQFINEVHILSQINHRNVVKLLGCCLEAEVPLLVYEFISNGTLSSHIHDRGRISFISLANRIRIAAETAAALYYLHSAASMPIFHRDVKSTNILLDDNLTAKVSDFGASRLVPLDQTQITTLVRGTLGYFDPEYFQTGQLTEKSDVYSFGVVLVELLTGEKPLSSTRSESMRNLSAYFLSSLEENRLFEILEEGIHKEGNEEVIIAIAQLAKRCLKLRGEKRPSMKEVVVELERVRSLSEPPQDPNEQEDCESLIGEPSEFCITTPLFNI